MLTQAVILCGGPGTRLGELTASMPKPMLSVAGRPFLEILIQEAARFGFTDIVLLAGYSGTQISGYFHGRTMFRAQIRVCVEPAPRGTGGALRDARPALAPEFLLMNGDSWIDADLRSFAGTWEHAKAQAGSVVAQMLLHEVSDAGRFGIVETVGARVTAFREKDTAAAAHPGVINSGVYVFRREFVDSIRDGASISLETEALPLAIADGKVRAVQTKDGTYFVDIGVPESYARAQSEVPTVRSRPAVFFDRDGTLNIDTGYTHRVEDLRWNPEAREAVAFANARGCYVFVVTNQAGVAKGVFSEEAILEFHAAMQADLFEIGAHIDAIEWCPHHMEATIERYRRDCPRRKPAGGMLAHLVASWPIDLQQSVMIGDSAVDMAAAASVGVRGVRYGDGSLLALLRDALGG